MKTKPADVFYCGVDQEKIKSSSPKINFHSLEILQVWIKERYEIHLKKDIFQKAKPWTEYKPLQEYKFTNVKRYHDRQSKFLINLIVRNKDLSYEEKLLNIILFRTWNKEETFNFYGGPFKVNQLLRYPEEQRQDKPKEFLPFNSAFSTSFLKEFWRFSDGRGELKFKNSKRENLPEGVYALHENIPLRMFYLTRWTIQQNILQDVNNSKTQEEVFETLLKIPGIGKFLAYQIFVDFSYIESFPFSENEFTISGPGCTKGLNLLFENRAGLSDEELIFWIRDNQNELFNIDFKSLMWDLPEYDRHLTVMDIENCMCEHSKHSRLIDGTGRPRIKYPGKIVTQIF